MGLWAEMKPLLKDRLFPVRIATTKERNPSPPVLFQMATGYWVSQAIYVAAKLGIADLLKEGPQSCVALATATGTDAPSLFRLMRALAAWVSFRMSAEIALLFPGLQRAFRPVSTDLSGRW
jgi:hypothetical protein